MTRKTDRRRHELAVGDKIAAALAIIKQVHDVRALSFA